MSISVDTGATTLAAPLTLPSGTTLKNRLAKAALSEQLAGPAHQPPAEPERAYRRWAAGGWVRDHIMKNESDDIDIATDATPEEVRALFRRSRLIGRRFRIAQVFFRGRKYIEVSTFRRKSEFEEEEAENPPPPSENTFGTPQEDALRLDITINGIFYSPLNFSLIDYVGGDGGFILSTGCDAPHDAKWENMKALVDTGKTYELSR